MYNYIKVNRIKLLLIPLILYWIFLFIGTSLPANPSVNILEISDKLKHFIAYMGLSFLLALNLHFQERSEKLAVNFLIYSFLICITYGILDELHQLLVPNRSADVLDWLADSLGSILGTAIAYFTIKKLKKK